MAFTLIMVASAYALANIQEVFILITFIFVGAIGIVTVSLSAVYKFKPKSQLSSRWAIPSAITVLVVSSIFLGNDKTLSFETTGIVVSNEYLVLLSSFIALMVLLMISVLSISRGD
jgi:NADH-quinone oxidoreductase subunit J